MSAPHAPEAPARDRRMPLPDDLAARARQAGVATQYHAFWGEEIAVAAEALAHVLDAMGDMASAQTRLPLVMVAGEETTIVLDNDADEPWAICSDETGATGPQQDPEGGCTILSGKGRTAVIPATLIPGYYVLRTPEQVTQLIVRPRQCWVPPGLDKGERWWGLCTQLYALRSESNWGVGDFSDLAAVVRIAAARGAAFVGTSPLHALRTEAPEAASPYSPSSRLAYNVLHIDVTALPGFTECEAVRQWCESPEFQRRFVAARTSPVVLYAEVAALKEPAFALLWNWFRDHEWAPRSPRGQAFAAFMQNHEQTLGLHARYEAIQRHLHTQDPSVWGWPAWPAEMQAPQSPSVQAFLAEHADAVLFRYWLQWQAHEQLVKVHALARQLMPVGLYCDLAVGASDGGSETWSAPGLFARGASVGAPPDPLNVQGQDWGLPPMKPGALVAARLAPWRTLLQAAMHTAGALRIDHAMALMRLYWNTPGGGTYVHYPLDAMLAVAAIESHRHRCTVIGEDLGTVAPQMREAMAQHAVFSYRPLIFERTESGAFRPPAEWPCHALAVVSTHDLPTLRGFWNAADVAVQKKLGWLDAEGAGAQALSRRAQDRTWLLAALEAEHLLPEGITPDPQSSPDMTPALAGAVHAYLARTASLLVGVQLEDLVGQVEQANVPGTTEAMHPNWRQRMAVPVEEMAGNAYFVAITSALQARYVAAPQPDTDLLRGGLPLPDLGTADVPRATYRVQMHQGFTFRDATAAIPYLHALGVSHLYTSPYLKAAAGSTHGYDVVDPTQLNPEIGTAEDHAALCATLARHSMGHVLDIVPNHMGVGDPGNRWWQDVLEHGKASPHAATFDIEWNMANPQTGGRVLLPVLGDHMGKVLANGDLSIGFDAMQGRFVVEYFEHRFPLDPRSYAQILAAVALPALPGQEQALAEAASLRDAFAALPPHDAAEPARSTRLRDAQVCQRRLADLVAQAGWATEWINACLVCLNGVRNESAPRPRPALAALLQSQPYRLADWRVASDDINYRRFFDVNGLAAIRMEDPALFDAVHALPLQWLAEGKVSGLRIDHPDGLAQPARYFHRLQQRHVALQAARGQEPRALYVVVEKIMADHEPLPADWPVHGGTGYRFSAVVHGLFVDASAEKRFDAAYRSYTGDVADLDETTYACKRLIIETTLFSDMAWLVDTLARIAQADPQVCDFTRNRLRMALVEVAAQFPVYRTYLAPGGPPSEADRRHIAWAISAARRRMGRSEGGELAYLEGILLGQEGPEPALREAFVRRWQQFTAPVTAKAIEDTFFYRYLRLASLNDVGGEPRRFGVSVAAFHHSNLQRSRHFPHQMLATSTHDSKRSEDVRARLNVLSEMPDEWEQLVLALEATGQRFQTERDGTLIPQRRDLWNLYQAMVGLWPARALTAAEKDLLVERLQRYMVKALREAKQDSHWLFPDFAYEEAVTRYVEKALALERFTQLLGAFVQRIAPWGARNSLCQVALKLTAPGVPDIYQGCEVWNFSLVDPDNRRPVDLSQLSELLTTVLPHFKGRYPEPTQWHAWLDADMPDATKQAVTWRLLQLRQALPELFRNSVYLPLAVHGTQENHALAFARIQGDMAVAVVCGRLLARLAGAGWADTQVAWASAHPALARVAHWRNWLTGERIAGAESVALQDVLGDVGPASGRLPFAVLVAEGLVP